MLNNIHSPKDLAALSPKELSDLSAEIRDTILGTVSRNGGHLASNLGMVEATLAIHRVFHSPDDQIIFDVGHQCYPHKLLTDRFRQFDTLRTHNGISGFPNRFESSHDPLTEGHSGTSVSSALGIATANAMSGKKSYTVAVVGDGSLTNGMIYEALNNCSAKNLRLIIIMNDNTMSISPNIGGLHNYLSRIRISKKYFSLKRRSENLLGKIPLIGKPLTVCVKKTKDFLKRLFIKNTLFEDLGLCYLGPVDGHDRSRIENVLQEAKTKDVCCIVHLITEKGRGYRPAEENPSRYHGVHPFDKTVGIKEESCADFSHHFGETLLSMTKNDPDICAITAAMCDGTGLSAFSAALPDRFFDVGIAEEHAVTFSAGLSVGGKKPVLALYSTFAQRVSDQLIHDIALQKLPLTLMLDRCGLVPHDGITHQGIFDYPMFSCIPHTEIFEPATYDEQDFCLRHAIGTNLLSIIRYPKGKALPTIASCSEKEFNEGFSVSGTTASPLVVITAGREFGEVRDAVSRLTATVSVTVIRLIRLLPLPTESLLPYIQSAKAVLIVEEGIKQGGFAETLAADISCRADAFAGRKLPFLQVIAIPSFVEHGTLDELRRDTGIDSASVEAHLHRLYDKTISPSN